MEQRIKELNKEIRNLKHARSALKIIKYGTWGGQPRSAKNEKTIMNDIESLDRKYVNEINEHQHEIEEIKNKMNH